MKDMTKVLAAVFITAIVGLFFSCEVPKAGAGASSDITGTWNYDSGAGVTMSYVFNSDGTFIQNVNSAGVVTKLEGTYTKTDSTISVKVKKTTQYGTTTTLPEGSEMLLEYNYKFIGTKLIIQSVPYTRA